jgi:hypothetical protein
VCSIRSREPTDRAKTDSGLMGRASDTVAGG